MPQHRRTGRTIDTELVVELDGLDSEMNSEIPFFEQSVLRQRRSPWSVCLSIGLLVATGFASEHETDMKNAIRSVHAMGTRLTLEVSASDRAIALAASEAVLNAVEVAEARLSTWRKGSELDRLNRAAVGEWVGVSPELARELAIVLEWAVQTDGAFDPVVGSLVAAWDLRGDGAIPSERWLADIRATTGHRLLEVEERRVRRLNAGAVIEEGGFGKGAGLRDAVAAATKAGAECLFIDFGGQLVMTPACGPVTVAVANPRDRTAVVAEILVHGGSVATSGNSERNLEVDGRRIGHLLDPRSGRPAPDWGAVTVIARDPLDADCVATALFVMGPGEGLRWLESMEEVEAVFAVVLPSGGVELRTTPGVNLVESNREGIVARKPPSVIAPDAREHGPPAH